MSVRRVRPDAHLRSAQDDVELLVGAGERGRPARRPITCSCRRQDVRRSIPPRPRSISTPPSFPYGGAGLVMSARDYDRFLHMLQNGGTLDGVRIMKPETAALAMSNLLPAGVEFGGVAGATGGTSAAEDGLRRRRIGGAGGQARRRRARAPMAGAAPRARRLGRSGREDRAARSWSITSPPINGRSARKRSKALIGRHAAIQDQVIRTRLHRQHARPGRSAAPRRREAGGGDGRLARAAAQARRISSPRVDGGRHARLDQPGRRARRRRIGPARADRRQAAFRRADCRAMRAPAGRRRALFRAARPAARPRKPRPMPRRAACSTGTAATNSAPIAGRRPRCSAPAGDGKCPNCGAEHFPRVDPVVIMIAEHDGPRAGRARAAMAGGALFGAGRVHGAGRIDRGSRRARNLRGSRRARPQRALYRQPALAVPVIADDGLYRRGGGRRASRSIPHELQDAMWVSREEVRQSLAGDRRRRSCRRRIMRSRIPC